MRQELILTPCTEKSPPCDPRNCPKENCAWRDTVWIHSKMQTLDRPGTFGKLKSNKKKK